jgi:acetyl-CoA carboxylase carboxyl transferase subunit alpha
LGVEHIPLEKPLADLEAKIDELRRMASTQAINLDREIAEIEERAFALRKQMFSNLTPYETTQISRHPRRPSTLELIAEMCSEFVEMHGDRNFLDDQAIVGGLAVLEGKSIVIIGHQKGRGTKENIKRNFGMPRPEGYRKALRLMSMAERFKLPIVTLIDTPGAFPGVDAEERGQSEAIGKNIMVMAKLKVPVISIVIGEGGSGGALALAVANKVYMLSHATYSVISPEGCASILMKDSGQAYLAAESLQLMSKPTLKLGIIDGIIEEPLGGAHRSIQLTAMNIKEQISKDLGELSQLTGDELRSQRISRFLSIDFTSEVAAHA